MKFKVGDKVRIVENNSDQMYEKYIGECGTIIENDYTDMPYRVKIDNEDLRFEWFEEDEVELVESELDKWNKKSEADKIMSHIPIPKVNEYVYTYKINMNNGDSFIVKSNISNTNDFINLVLGNGKQGIVVTHFELVNMDCESSHKYNWVVIINTNVSSIEYYC